MSGETLARWKANYGGMNVSEAHEKRSLDEEHAELRKLVTGAARDFVECKPR